jgi:hypothetical protein
MKKNSKFHERFDPKGVEPLVQAAKAGDIKARDQLLYQFRRLISSLIEVCLTARINHRTKQVQFLRLWVRGDTPLEDMAHKLRNQLSVYSKDELWHVGELACLLAIEKTRQNYSSTIVQCFKELILDLIADGTPKHIDESALSAKICPQTEDDLIFDIWRRSLSPQEQEQIESILVGDKVPLSSISPELQLKFAEYLGLEQVPIFPSIR